MPFVGAVALAGLTPAATPQDAGLEIVLSASVTRARPGDEVRFRADFVNRSGAPFRILELTQFLGDELVIEDENGRSVTVEGGVLTYSPKVNVFTGTTRLVPAGQKVTLTWDALLDDRLRLVFEERRKDPPDSLDAAFGERFGLPADFPAKYIGTGRVFPLPGPGRYRVRFVYRHALPELQWRLVSDPAENGRLLRELWRGTATSNRIEIDVESAGASGSPPGQ
jgi:hypothetical protein